MTTKTIRYQELTLLPSRYQELTLLPSTKTNTAWESGITPDGELQFYRLIETN